MLKLENKLYTSSEVAQILGVSLRSVYRYIEEGNLDAEVKTATGRHRFTKANILDFLYPNGAADTSIDADDDFAPTVKMASKPIAATRQTVKQPAQPKVETPAINDFDFDFDDEEEELQVLSSHETEQVAVKTNIVSASAEDSEDAEEVDWLQKFREAARKFEEETTTSVHAQAPIMKSPTLVYYRSALGGLRDIAQNLDKTSRTSNVDYAFTLSAGLSLFKPIKPFALLHAYIRPGDKNLFENMLKLQPAQEDNSQLCLLLSDDDALYESMIEMHGLKVVSKERLSQDVSDFGDAALKEEASSIL